MSRLLTHKNLVKFHNDIADAYVGINGFYRFNWNEINGALRPGVETPALLLESYSAEIEENQNRTTHFNRKAMSFLILEHGGTPDDYELQETVLDQTENIALDIFTYLKKEHKNRNSILFGLIESGSLRYEKVGPIFGTYYGWNVLYTIKPQEPLCYDPQKWNFPPDSA